MRLWRITGSGEFRPTVLPAHGARWNRAGTEVIYAASSLALATLEVSVRVDRRTTPDEMTAHLVEVPDDVKAERVDVAGLPTGWDAYPGPAELRAIGTEWVERGEALLLIVPTALLRIRRDLIPTEVNYLINPAHTEFHRVRATPHAYRLDARVYRRASAGPSVRR